MARLLCSIQGLVPPIYSLGNEIVGGYKMPNLGFGGLPKVSRPPRLPAIAGSNRPPLAVREGEKDGMTSLPQEKMDF